MRIIDMNNQELISPNETMGKLVQDRIFVAHHSAVEAVEEVWHYETVAEYPNGGKDVRRVVDIPGVMAAAAWDEYEDILRYVPYTQEELAKAQEKLTKAQEEQSMPSALERIRILEERLEKMLSEQTGGNN